MITLAWAAGLFDGEGSFCISISNPYSNHPHIKMQMELPNTHEPTVKRFYEIVKIGSYAFRERTNNINKDFYQWLSQSYEAVEATKMLLPYLVTKKERAELFIEFSNKWERRQGSRGDNSCSAELLAMWSEMKDLNKRGK